MDELLTRTYKRSQVEQVIGMLEFRMLKGRTDPALRSRLKRLLDADRASVSDDQVRAGKRLAFLDGIKPGAGSEIGYSAYQAFALLTGVRLLQGGLTEGRTVALLQRTRPTLEGAFRRIAAVPRRQLQDDYKDPNDPKDTGITALQAEQRVRDGLIVNRPEKMTFLVEVVCNTETDDLSSADADGASLSVCNYKQLYWRLRYISHAGKTAVIFELTNAVHQILYFLPHTTVRKRGRQ